MSLTYVKTVRTYQEDGYSVTRTRVPVTVPTHWSMFTSSGNRRIAGYARTFLKKVERLIEKQAPNHKYHDAAVAFLTSWMKAGSLKGTPEATDTAVRECVGDFHDMVLEAAIGEGQYDAWERNLERAYQRRSKS